MVAMAVKQRVAIMGVRTWEAWRAVCSLHPEHDYLIPPWQADDVHDAWIDAQIEAARHNHLEHPVLVSPTLSWGEITQPFQELEFSNSVPRYSPQHVKPRWFQRR